MSDKILISKVGLSEKPFVIGKNAIETESFRIFVFKKEGENK